MKLLLATSAFSNPDLLVRCVQSWPLHSSTGAVVYFDGLQYNENLAVSLPNMVYQLKPEPPEHKGCAGSWNKLLEWWYSREEYDYILVVGSDTSMLPCCVDAIIRDLEKDRPDFGDVKDMGFNAWFLSRKG